MEKIEKITKNLEIISRPDDTYANRLKINLNNSIKYLESFYNIKIPESTIELIYSRKEFEEKTGYKKVPNGS